ncbi:MAG: hypothetical protein WC956_01680 [bacterium]
MPIDVMTQLMPSSPVFAVELPGVATGVEDVSVPSDPVDEARDLELSSASVYATPAPLATESKPPIAQLKNGHRILSRYETLLSQKGCALKEEAEALLSRTRGGADPSADDHYAIGDLLSRLPTVKTPHLELFRRPSIEPFEMSLRLKDPFYVLEINEGCENGCTFCDAFTPRQTRFMPYPMILGLAESIRAINGDLALNCGNSDPMQYRDTVFGADLGDVMRSVKDIYRHDMLYCFQTHGWPRGHRFARSAAEKLYRMGFEAWRISVHLFHREFFDPAPAPEVFDRYAAQFIEAISLLRPEKIVLYGYQERYTKFPIWDHFAIERFFYERIYPHLDEKLRARYPCRPTRRVDRRTPVSPPDGPFGGRRPTSLEERRKSLGPNAVNFFVDGSYLFHEGKLELPFGPIPKDGYVF